MASTGVGAFLSGQVFLITGVTGFLGKVLLAKLLHECGTALQPSALYVLVRGKKEQAARERFEQEVFAECKMFGPIVARFGLEHLRKIITVRGRPRCPVSCID